MKIDINIIDLLSILLIFLLIYNMYEIFSTKESFVTFKNIKEFPNFCNNKINQTKRKCKAKIVNIKESMLSNVNKVFKRGQKLIKKTVFPKEIKITF